MARQPHLLVEPGDLTDIALVPGDPGRVDRIAGLCDDHEVVAENREYKLVNATYDGRELTICSTGIGSPSTAIAVEELEAVGVETLIRVGTTGALQEGIEIGDMVVANGAAKDEGTSQRYESKAVPAVPDYDVLSSLVDAAEANDEDVHVGPIATDDAFYAETDEYINDWEAAGRWPSRWRPPRCSRCSPKGLRSGASEPSTVPRRGDLKVETVGEELPEKDPEQR